MYIHFVCFVEYGDHGVQPSLAETKLLQHMLDIGSLSVELWVAEVSDIYKHILKKEERSQKNEVLE